MSAVAIAPGASAQQQPVPSNIPQGSPLNQPQTDPQASSPAPSTERRTQTDDQPSFSTNGAQPYEPTALGPQSTSAPLTPDQLARAQPNVLNTRIKGPPAPREFESYVARLIGRPLPRFGKDLILPAQRDFAVPNTATVPPDYRLNIGDTIVISLTGSVSGSVERQIDTDGNIFLPNVGSIRLVGVRYADTKDKISAAIGTKYRDYTVTVSVKQLRGIRVYVTGFANNPGAFTVGSLSTMANAVFQAGGPSSGGSFRSVKLYRDGAEIGDFDLYDLVRGGSRVKDLVLENEDVLFIPPAGEQVAVIGSVNEEAIYELKPGETLERVLALAGGANDLGDPDRFILYRSKDPAEIGPVEILRDRPIVTAAKGGQILQVLSKGSLLQPLYRQKMLVRIEGEVDKPGNYYVAPGTPLLSVLAMAGGLTPRAYAFGARLERQSVRAQQREGYQEALRQMEIAVAGAGLTADTSLPAAERATQLASARELLERLRNAQPDGRLVIDIAPDAVDLPGDIVLENNDAIIVPPKSSTVGVFGAVYRPASFLIQGAALRVRDYIDQAGGLQRVADKGGIIVVRGNGAVLSKRRGALTARALPGDVIFVPVRTSRSNFLAKLRDISTIIFQLGLSAAIVGSAIK